MTMRHQGAGGWQAPRTSCPTASTYPRLTATFAVVLVTQSLLLLALLLLHVSLVAAFAVAAGLMVVDMLALRAQVPGLRQLLARLVAGGDGQLGVIGVQ